MEKSAPITKRINIQLDDIRKESRRRLCESKEKKSKKRSHWNCWKSKLNQKMEESTTVIVGDSMLVEIEEKCISGNRSVKARIFPRATTHYMYDHLKPLLKKNPDNFIFHDASMKYYIWKILLKNCAQHAKL